VISPQDTPEGASAVCVDASGVNGELTEGRTYVVQYWDGCCISVRGDDGIGVTVNRARFVPSVLN
jgi:hypothetical protein